MIVDIGGNPSRHATMKRVNVHSANPILSSADVARSANHQGAPNTCSHTAQECDCVIPAAYLSVDSLYYLSPDDVAYLVERSLSKLLVAVIHEFNDAYGAFADGEATYQLLSSDTVSMSVRGNSSAYTHGNLGWMRKNSHQYVANGVLKTLVWTQLEHYANRVTYTFHVTSAQIPTDAPLSSGLVSPLQSPSGRAPTKAPCTRLACRQCRVAGGRAA
jgi:hypothetical protein